jgi:peroxiredoxin
MRAVRTVIGAAAVTSMTVFAVVKDQSLESGYCAGASLGDVVKSTQTWDVVFTSWFDKQASDFAIEDVEGNKHTLSDYRGRDLLVVFWATWCPACNLEIPHLIELRKMLPDDQLAILAISNEAPEHLKHFAAAKKMNYTVASLGDTTLPAPFADVTSIPTTFFIDRHGTIKLAAVGVVSLDEAKAILQARQQR